MSFIAISMVSCIGLGDSSSSAVLNVNSFVDPDYRGTAFTKVLIDVPFENFAVRQSWESTLAQYLFAYKMTGVESNKLFLPTRTYSAQDSLRILAEAGVDACLQFNVRLYSYAKEYYSDGQPMEKPNVAFNWVLSDLKNNRTVWIGDGYNGGNVFDNLDGITNTLLKEIMKTLAREGIIEFAHKADN